MAEIGIGYTLVTDAGTIVFNDAAEADIYRLSAVDGMDGAPIRVSQDDAPRTDGGLVHDAYLGPRHITFTGNVKVTSAVDSDSLKAANADMIAFLIASVESILRVDGTLTWTPSGGSPLSLTVRADLPVQTTTEDGAALKKFVFGLVAANPVPA